MRCLHIISVYNSPCCLYFYAYKWWRNWSEIKETYLWKYVQVCLVPDGEAIFRQTHPLHALSKARVSNTWGSPRCTQMPGANNVSKCPKCPGSGGRDRLGTAGMDWCIIVTNKTEAQPSTPAQFIFHLIKRVLTNFEDFAFLAADWFSKEGSGWLYYIIFRYSRFSCDVIIFQK